MPALEELGIQPVPREQRTGTWLDLFAILFAFGINPLYYVLGGVAVVEFGLPLWWAVGTAVLAQLIGYGFLTVVAQVGCDYGIPGQVSLRAFLGVWGARVLSSGYRSLAALYWFAAQAIVAATALRALFEALVGIHLPIVPVSIGLAALQALLAIAGFDVLRYVTRVVLPLGLAFVGVILALYLTSDDPRFDPDRVLSSPGRHVTWVGVAGYLTLIIGSQLTFLPSVADFTRYTRSRRHMRVGMISSAVLAMVVTTFVGGYAGAAIGTKDTPFEVVTTLTASKPLLAFVVLCLVVLSLAVNIGNAYNLGLSIVNAVPRLGRFAGTALGAAVGIAVAGVPDLLTSASDWITRLGTVAAPLATVVLIDYVFVQKQRLDVDDLYEMRGAYRYAGGVNVAAVVAIAAGVVAYTLVPAELFKAAWGGGVGAALYVALLPVQRRLTAAVAA